MNKKNELNSFLEERKEFLRLIRWFESLPKIDMKILKGNHKKLMKTYWENISAGEKKK